MKKIIFGIFAHPDDEAFGPAGTLLSETKSGTEVNLICLTNGSAGTNPDGLENLGEVREKEWRAAGELIGANHMVLLGYGDGELCNQSMIEIGYEIREKIIQILDGSDENAEIEFMTNDLGGITGHIDHIVAARTTCWLFSQLKAKDSRFKRVRMACLPQSLLPTENSDWLFMEAGRPDDEIDQVVDATHLNQKIIEVMRAHHTQRTDCENHVAKLGDNIGINYFIVKQ